MIDKFLWTLRGQHKFCRGCGKELERKARGYRFDRNTGTATVVLVELGCPKFTGYNEFERNIHDVYVWREKVSDG